MAGLTLPHKGGTGTPFLMPRADVPAVAAALERSVTRGEAAAMLGVKNLADRRDELLGLRHETEGRRCGGSRPEPASAGARQPSPQRDEPAPTPSKVERGARQPTQSLIVEEIAASAGEPLEGSVERLVNLTLAREIR